MARHAQRSTVARRRVTRPAVDGLEPRIAPAGGILAAGAPEAAQVLRQFAPAGSGPTIDAATADDALPATSTVVTASAPSSTYGDPLTFTATVAPVAPATATPTGTVQFQVDGADVGLPVALVDGVATLVPAVAVSAGPHSLTAVYANADDSFAGSQGTLAGGLDVGKAPLTITAANAAKVYGAPLPQMTASYGGFVLGQDASALGGSLTFSTPATAASHVGQYAVTPGGLTSSNYAINFVPGSLFVTEAPLTIRADSATKRFGAPVPALTARYSGLVNGDTPARFATPLTVTTPATAASPPGFYPIVPAGATDPDYAIFFIDGTLTVRPEVAGDYNGDGRTDFALFYRPPTSATGVWYVTNTTAQNGVPFGSSRLDVPVQGDFNGDGKADIAVYRPSTAQWFVGGQPTIAFGQPNVSIPVPGNYDGLGSTQVAVYQPNTGQWFIGGHAQPLSLGVAPRAGDLPVPADYDGTGKTEIAIYRPGTGQWFIQGHAQPITFGGPNDVPVPGDYDGIGRAELALYRPATQQWFVGGHAQPVQFGGPGDVPVPGDYDGVGRTQYVVYRPKTGQWFIGGHAGAISYGGPHLVPAAAPYAYRSLAGPLRIQSANAAGMSRLDLGAAASRFAAVGPASAAPRAKPSPSRAALLAPAGRGRPAVLGTRGVRHPGESPLA